MTSAGNDIVSLNAINSNRTKQSWFYSHILSSTEEAIYEKPEIAALPFEYFVWLLWTIKESAYKYLQRIKPDLIFSPTKFIVQELQIPSGFIVTNFEGSKTEDTGFENNSTIIKGIINVGPDTIFSRSIIYKELITSVVNGDENFENICWGIKLINKSDAQYQSTAVRQLLITRLQRLLRNDNLAIGKSPHGFPILLEGGNETTIPVSISHHDRLVAYSFQS